MHNFWYSNLVLMLSIPNGFKKSPTGQTILSTAIQINFYKQFVNTYVHNLIKDS